MLIERRRKNMKKFKPIPKFKNEDEEREFWATHDSTEYINWNKAKRAVFPNLKLTSRPVTIRMPLSWIDQLKVKANKMDMPYQTLIKQIIFKNLNE